MVPHRFRRVLLSILPPLGTLLSIGAPAAATWSIVVVDRSTGEVCVAGATCLSNLDLRRTLTVIVVGKGGGAAQSAIDSDGSNRMRMWDGIQAGLTPQRILADLLSNDVGYNTRQYGIATLTGESVGFSGKFAGQAKCEVYCEVGDLAYSIQGNVLAGPAVCWRAQEALLLTEGDLGQRVMAAMEAARAWGGDGRCSCSTNHPDQCGSPPPDFEKSAHIAFMVLARLGDQDGTCTGAQGCANGNYYLALDVIAGVSAPDPVLVLARDYGEWRESKLGLADHLLTRVTSGADRLVADGQTGTEVLVELRDLEDDPLGFGGQTLALTYTGDQPPVAIAGPIVDHGDGTHGFEVTATNLPGRASWQIVVQQSGQTIQLHPELEIEVDPLADLHVGFERFSMSNDDTVPFVVNRGVAEAGRLYLLLGSARGTVPGTPWNGLIIPLNHDRLFVYTLSDPGAPAFVGGSGVLDAGGRAEAWLDMSLVPGGDVFVGRHLDFCGLLGGNPEGLTGLVGFDVVP